MFEERFCPHCQKKLRSDNTKGMCAKCQARGRKLDGEYGDRAAKPSTSAYAKKVETPPAKSTVIEPPDVVLAKFRTVSEALGFDPDEELAKAAQGWLDQVREMVVAADSSDEG